MNIVRVILVGILIVLSVVGCGHQATTTPPQPTQIAKASSALLPAKAISHVLFGYCDINHRVPGKNGISFVGYDYAMKYRFTLSHQGKTVARTAVVCLFEQDQAIFLQISPGLCKSTYLEDIKRLEFLGNDRWRLDTDKGDTIEGKWVSLVSQRKNEKDDDGYYFTIAELNWPKSIETQRLISLERIGPRQTISANDLKLVRVRYRTYRLRATLLDGSIYSSSTSGGIVSFSKYPVGVKGKGMSDLSVFNDIMPGFNSIIYDNGNLWTPEMQITSKDRLAFLSTNAVDFRQMKNLPIDKIKVIKFGDRGSKRWQSCRSTIIILTDRQELHGHLVLQADINSNLQPSYLETLRDNKGKYISSNKVVGRKYPRLSSIDYLYLDSDTGSVNVSLEDVRQIDFLR